MKNLFFWTLLGLGLLISCDSSRNEYLAGDDWVEPDVRMKLIDTLSLKMSTILMDSVITSGQSKLLLGRTKDDIFGEVKSSSFFEITPSAYSVTNKTTAVYDSIALFLTYNDYYYGDTLKTFKLNVYPVENRIKLRSDGYLYNTSNTTYTSNEIGSASFLPRPTKEDAYLKIKLNNNYGQSLFNLIKSGTVTNQEYFLNFFKGLALVPSDENQAFLSFGLTDEITASNETFTTVMRMYYHSKSENGTESSQYTIDFNVNSALQYNKITHDFTGSELENLTSKNPLNSQQANNKAYQFSALGIYTKIEVPYIKNILNLYPNVTILDANMNIKPVYGTYNGNNYLPEKLHYYVADKTNSILSSFTSTTSQEVSITLSENNEFQDNSIYAISVTDYLKNIVTEGSEAYGYNILLFPTNYKEQQIERIVIGNSSHSTNKSNIKLYLLGY